MRRIFTSLRLRFVVELETGLEQLDQSLAVPLRRVRLPDAGSTAIHANLNHRLIVRDLQVAWLRNDRRNLQQLEETSMKHPQGRWDRQQTQANPLTTSVKSSTISSSSIENNSPALERSRFASTLANSSCISLLFLRVYFSQYSLSQFQRKKSSSETFTSLLLLSLPT
jgi:hypothetical protein